ncbi:hypothetical protein [Pedosphaera parvula]|uniref:DUF4878 domain-containing protein n=1 Tax=Pedosphaera parvula (strain Ellin514) TaxID=320771 RepID=B9XRI1_PEDPL|nr:hypothetical protein [Pedosphaera parvula]EEF57552.1 hypothetical protein Cflav_PD0602 [Pedosphaera parvula Ellin514]
MAHLKIRILVACLLLGMATGLVMQHQSLRKLQNEVSKLSRDHQFVNEVVMENKRLSNLLAQAHSTQVTSNGWFRELLRLRGEVTSLRNQREQTSFVDRQSNSHPLSTLEHFSQAPVAKESFAFAGYGSPESAFQTALWAMSNGDTNAILASLTPDERVKKEKEWTGLSEAEVLTRTTNDLSEIRGYRIIGREVISDDEVELKVDFDADLTKMKMRVKRVDGEWKFVGQPEKQ